MESWIDRSTFKRLNCVDDDSAQPVGVVEPAGGVRMPGPVPLAGSPRNFLATTVGDEFKAAHQGRPKVISISSKDRAAVLLGGKLANAAYWMDKGRMISSTYYLKELPAWGWRISGAEITRSEEFSEAFRASFRDEATEAPYLSYNDAHGREVRVYFFERDIERPLLEEHRALLERAKVRDLKLIS